MKTIYFSILVLVSALIASCSSYNKILKSDDYQKKFDTANELYDDNKYERCIALYEQVYQRFPKQGEGELSYFRIGKSYYLGADYYMAGYFLGQFTQRFPFSPKVEEATFLSAMCSVNNSPAPSLDQTDTEVALNELQQFIDRFPESELIDSCNHIMDRLRFKLERKDYDAVKLYSKTENYRAAVTSAEQFVLNYSISKFKEEIFYLWVKNSYLLAVNSIESKKMERTVDTIERYRNFVNEFPSSDYKKELDGIHDKVEGLRVELEQKKEQKSQK